MRADQPRSLITTTVAAHPAVRSWLAVTGSGRVPGSVMVVRERQSPHKAIYRLPDVGEGGAAVIAKRAPAHQIRLERLINELFLPRLEVTIPRYYGSCLDGPDGWLFLEDVGPTRYALSDPQHLRVGARWVGALHAGASRLGCADGLPEAVPSRYLAQLRAAGAKVRGSLERWAFAPAEVEILTRLLSWLEAIEGSWQRVEAGCAGAPATLVHGDFQPKNVYLRGNGKRLHVCPIDWEMAGWGPPAIDLTRIDTAIYWREVRETWPDVDFGMVERFARFGRVLEAVAAVDWESESLRLEDVAYRSEAVSNIGLFLQQLIAAARAVGVAA